MSMSYRPGHRRRSRKSCSASDSVWNMRRTGCR